jgi:peptidoglycan hydrolase-like protein with peptidoglycan-binding domain
MCKTINAIPILCIGHTEERTSWLTRNPVNHCDFLEQFCKYLSYYLRNNFGFIQAHLEVFNEPQKCIPVNDYAKICISMGRGFKQYPNFKVHIGSNDIEIDLNEYIEYLVKEHELEDGIIIDAKKYADYYSTHVLWPRQHNQGYIAKVNSILKGTNLKQSVTEFSPDGDWDTFDELINNGIDIYCILFVLRNDFFGDVLDDIFIFDKHKGPEIISYNQDKHIMLKAINNRYFNKPLPIEDEDMKLEKFYYKNKVTYNADPKHAGVKFIQDCLGLLPDGNFGIKTENAVKAYQLSKGFKDDGIVGKDTFTALIDEFPRLFDELQYNVATGIW